MRGWLLVPCLLVACSSDQVPPEPSAAQKAPLAALPESDRPAPALLGSAWLPDGRRVEARAGDEPGESDLWLVDANGAASVLAPAPGPDERPVALSDGRVAFVSGRSTVMSLWLVEPASGRTLQLSNRGLRAGALGPGFVPAPAAEINVAGRTLFYDDADGKRWQLEVEP